MAAVSLIDFAKNHRQDASPGVEVIVTPHCRITLVPDFPIPGPNSVSWIRCEPGEVDGVINQAKATFGARNLPYLWVIDPGTQPPDFEAQLAARGFRPDPHAEETTVMILPADAAVAAPAVKGLEIRDALADLESFQASDRAAAEAFGETKMMENPNLAAMQERRRLNAVMAGNRRLLLATVNGEPAGSGSLTLYPPQGAMINGGAVRPAFRGLGVYRALVAARLEIARNEGAAGLAVQAGAMSQPILSRLGFTPVSWRRFYT
jgi:GNAT superfamily N-acetyltransferase